MSTWQVISLIFLAYASIFIGSCQPQLPKGSVLVKSIHNGSYEIYRIESELPFQFVSEKIGHFNKEVSLEPGQYLILADCSSQTIIVRSHTKQTLVSHRIEFKLPQMTNLDGQSKFSVQCNRYDETRSRQHFTNKYFFDMLEGNRDLLVGMVPLIIDFPHQSPKPTNVTYNLSGLMVESYPNMKPKTKYFVSPSNGLIAITEPQEFGQWQFFLPGRYLLEVNGTSLIVEMEAGNTRTISPAFIQVTTPSKARLELSSQIRGTPLFVELNNHHWMDLNEIYPVLPGQASIKLNGSQVNHKVKLKSKILSEIKVKSLIVNYDCSPWEWTCLGGRKVYLYEQGKSYPFAEGVTDVPLLYIGEKIALSLEGSRDIRYMLPSKKPFISLNIGKLEFSPKPIVRQGQVTDLVRIEAINEPFLGHTLDIQFDRKTTMPLIVGTYSFTQYISSLNPDGQRNNIKKLIRVIKNQTRKINFNVLTTERKKIALQKTIDSNSNRRVHKKSTQRYLPAIGAKFR